MPHSGDQDFLIRTELRKLRSRLTDEGDQNETALLAICMGEFCQELLTRLTASDNITIEQARLFLLRLANTVGAHPRVPANQETAYGHLRVVK